jgi:hypothetical protein
MTPETRQQLLAATRTAAQAFAEDLTYFRDLLLNHMDITAAEIRRLSGEMRRILIDNGGDLEKIASPRVGRIRLHEPDNQLYYVEDRKQPCAFFLSGGCAVLGVFFRAVTLNEVTPGLVKTPSMRQDADRTCEVRQDGFLSQKVICLNGQWATRRNVIKYVANVAHGVHTGSPTEDVKKRCPACGEFARSA